jgi:hypothetical protein
MQVLGDELEVTWDDNSAEMMRVYLGFTEKEAQIRQSIKLGLLSKCVLFLARQF